MYVLCSQKLKCLGATHLNIFGATLKKRRGGNVIICHVLAILLVLSSCFCSAAAFTRLAFSSASIGFRARACAFSGAGLRAGTKDLTPVTILAAFLTSVVGLGGALLAAASSLGLDRPQEASMLAAFLKDIVPLGAILPRGLGNSTRVLSLADGTSLSDSLRNFDMIAVTLLLARAALDTTVCLLSAALASATAAVLSVSATSELVVFLASVTGVVASSGVSFRRLLLRAALWARLLGRRRLSCRVTCNTDFLLST